MAFIVADRVRDTATTTGTGVFTVSGLAPSTYRTFSAVCSVNDTLPYFIQNQSANEFEVGICTYSASNQLTRTASGVISGSSGVGTLVSFSAGTKDVVLGIPSTNAYARQLIQATTNFYLRTDGSDSNTGTANTSGGAWLTLQHAYNVVAALDLNSLYTVTLNVADGTYSTSGSNLSATSSWLGGSTFTILGNTGSPGNVIFTSTGADTIQVLTALSGTLAFNGCKITSSAGAGFVFTDSARGYVSFDNMQWGACSGAHIQTSASGQKVVQAGAYTINGAASIHLYANNGGFIQVGGAVTVSGTPAFSIFAYANGAGSSIQASGATYSGSATGTRFLADNLGWINNGAGSPSPNFFPGDAAGGTGHNGIYNQ